MPARAAPTCAEALCGRARRNAAGARAFPESNRRQRPRLALRRRRYRTRAEFVEAFARRRRRPLTIIEGGTPPAACAGGGGERRGQDDGEGAARQRGGPEPASSARSTRRARRSAKRVRVRASGSRDGSLLRPAGRTAQRHRPAGDRRGTLGRRGATARQALAPSRDRHRQRRDQRHRAAAARLDLLSDPRARAVRRRAARRRGAPPQTIAGFWIRSCQ